MVRIDLKTDKVLLTPTEAAQIKAEQAQSLVKQESIARQRAEEELLQLREEVERLKTQTTSSHANSQK